MPNDAQLLRLDKKQVEALPPADDALTTMRTGAGLDIGLLELARANSTLVCLFGTNAQARGQLSHARERRYI